MELRCPLCDATFSLNEAWVLRRHGQQVHTDGDRFWKCQLPGCGDSPAALMSVDGIMKHTADHYRLRHHVQDLPAPEDEADVPSFEPEPVAGPAAEREEVLFDLAEVPFDDWMTDGHRPEIA